jgi:membrane-bound metal-dependent hydrolase YbcI (DUF457 family)
MGVVSHLIRDTFTHHPFKALWPISDKQYGALHWTSASNKVANEGLVTLGTFAFMFCFLNGNGVIADLLAIFL